MIAETHFEASISFHHTPQASVSMCFISTNENIMNDLILQDNFM